MNDAAHSLKRALALATELREAVEAGDFDRVEPLLVEREEHLRTFRRHFSDDDAIPAELGPLWEANRRTQLELVEWLKAGKEEVAAQLGSLRQEGRDPFRERTVGATFLDRRA